MSNPIKYSTGSESLALKKGNFYIGTGDVGKGPTSTTGYYNGITPPSGGYAIYLNKETGGPSIYTASNDAQLISLTNSIAGTSYTTVNECLVYFAGQTDKMVLNRDYEGIVTDGLVTHLDAGLTTSYPKNGTTWYDNSISGINGTLLNGPTYSNNAIITDGANDYIQIFQSGDLTTESWTFRFVAKQTSYDGNRRTFFGLSNNGNFAFRVFNWQIWSNSEYVYVSFIGNGTSYNSISYSSASSSEILKDYCVTITPSLVTYYENAASIATATFTTMRYTFNRIWLATRGNQNLDGEFYLLSAYNRELSLSEIQQNYNAQKGRFGL
jgi:hypothetical protein